MQGRACKVLSCSTAIIFMLWDHASDYHLAGFITGTLGNFGL